MIDIQYAVDGFILQVSYYPRLLKYAKYLANVCYIISTLIIISPHIAAASLLPWKLYLVGNLIWAIDSLMLSNWAWFWMGSFFVVWDAIIITTRILNIELLPYFEPAIKIIENFI